MFIEKELMADREGQRLKGARPEFNGLSSKWKGKQEWKGSEFMVEPRVSQADAYVGPRESDESGGHRGFRVTLGSSGIHTSLARGSCGS